MSGHVIDHDFEFSQMFCVEHGYDDENRMTKITHPDGTFSTYTYSGDGLRRTIHEPGGSVRTMVWDGSDYLMET